MKKKDMYVSPQIEVIEMENEGVIAASGGGSLDGNMGNNPWSPKTSSKSMRGSSGANSSDLEDMINDILTIEN